MPLDFVVGSLDDMLEFHTNRFEEATPERASFRSMNPTFDPPAPMRSDSSRGITSFLYSAKRWSPPKVLLQKGGTLLAFHNGRLQSSFDISIDQPGVTAPEYSSINICTEHTSPPDSKERSSTSKLVAYKETLYLKG
ncbi:hypothetical protein M569_11124 [Genlisea aurea]|uniref:Uncharacterized protein n=1 Tax=Genlisea aurea TaxID=192259 RepID=S8CA20_9LAMI|nr:hypothetical protein M569_11124 [Genlisea aurea]